MLNTLMLAIKHSLKLLYSLGLSLKDMIMFSIRQCDQIAGAIIARHPVQMMDNPAFGQNFIVGNLPNVNMLTNISRFICSWVVWSQNHNVTIRGCSPTPDPLRMILTFLQFSGTLSTAFRNRVTWFATIKTWVLGVLIILALIHNYIIPYNHLNNKLGCEI